MSPIHGVRDGVVQRSQHGRIGQSLQCPFRFPRILAAAPARVVESAVLDHDGDDGFDVRIGGFGCREQRLDVTIVQRRAVKV